MNSNYHPMWQQNRINFILEQYQPDFFSGKRILELGPFNGYIGHQFSELGATVHCLEGRLDNVHNIKNQFPKLTVEQADLDTPEWPWGRWDIIINFGLYYHLEKYHRQHLINCLDNCDVLFFESVIYDSELPEIHFRSESGTDQSLTDIGGSPSTSYVENIFREKNTTFTKYSSPLLNGNGHEYDWKDLNTKVLHPSRRRFWTVVV